MHAIFWRWVFFLFFGTTADILFRTQIKSSSTFLQRKNRPFGAPSQLLKTCKQRGRPNTKILGFASIRTRSWMVLKNWGNTIHSLTRNPVLYWLLVRFIVNRFVCANNFISSPSPMLQVGLYQAHMGRSWRASERNHGWESGGKGLAGWSQKYYWKGCEFQFFFNSNMALNTIE